MPRMDFSLLAFSPQFWELISPHVELEIIAAGFQFLEGPAWDVSHQVLYFSDIVGNAIYCWQTDGRVRVFRKPSHMANGNTFDRQGRLVTCEHATSRVSRLEHDGNYRVLASHFRGKALNSPNDIVVHRNGSLFFSDPNYGRRERFGLPRPQELTFQGVYRLDPESGDLVLLADDFENPNGLCFDRNEKSLFVNDSPRGLIRQFDLLPDGRLAGGEVWAEVRGEGPGVPDGMKFDAAGNLYCCGPGGVYIYDGRANPLGKIAMPEQTANFTWGGPDRRHLLLTATSTLYRLQMLQPGFLPYAASLGAAQ